MKNYTDWLRQQQAVVRLVERLPRRPRATDDFCFGVRQMGREAALQRRYLQVNGNRLVGYLALDLDYSGAAYAWERVGLPPPTIITISPSSRAHYLYELNGPVAVTDSARPGPARFLEDVRSRYVDVLEADPLFSGQLTKNPLHGDWRVVVTNTSYQIGGLKEAVSAGKKKKIRQDSLDSRNRFLFDLARGWAYRHAGDFGSPENLFDAVRQQCVSANSFSSPLPLRELDWIAKSISRWVWPRRTNFAGDGGRSVVSPGIVEKVRNTAGRLGSIYRLGEAEMLQHYLSQVASEAGVSRDAAERARAVILSAIGS